MQFLRMLLSQTVPYSHSQVSQSLWMSSAPRAKQVEHRRRMGQACVVWAGAHAFRDHSCCGGAWRECHCA